MTTEVRHTAESIEAFVKNIIENTDWVIFTYEHRIELVVVTYLGTWLIFSCLLSLCLHTFQLHTKGLGRTAYAHM